MSYWGKEHLPNAWAKGTVPVPERLLEFGEELERIVEHNEHGYKVKKVIPTKKAEKPTTEESDR